MGVLDLLQGGFEQCLPVNQRCELFHRMHPLERLPCRTPEGTGIGFGQSLSQSRLVEIIAACFAALIEHDNAIESFSNRVLP